MHPAPEDGDSVVRDSDLSGVVTGEDDRDGEGVRGFSAHIPRLQLIANKPIHNIRYEEVIHLYTNTKINFILPATTIIMWHEKKVCSFERSNHPPT